VVEILAANRADQSLYEGVRKRHVGNRLDFRYLKNPKIGLPLVESIQRIMIRAEIFGQTLPANRSMKHPAQRHSIPDARVVKILELTETTGDGPTASNGLWKTLRANYWIS
jgi:hypothetical protein